MGSLDLLSGQTAMDILSHLESACGLSVACEKVILCLESVAGDPGLPLWSTEGVERVIYPYI